MTAHADLSPTLQLAIDLIRRPSVTPVDADCQKLMMQRLGDAGFALEPMRIEGRRKVGVGRHVKTPEIEAATF